ncbi:MAG: ABC transporter permease subunit [Candidatus Hodarchaeales archaeon]|jgi:ABC-type Na+ efflux pump permease subunit
MSSFSQFFYLVKQELRSASRTRYIIFAFIFTPLLMWGLQGGIQLVTTSTLFATSEGETLYVTNGDTDTIVPLSSSYELEIDFDGKKIGETVNEIKLSNYLISMLQYIAENDNTSTLYGINVITSHTYTEVETLSEEGNVKYWLHIPTGFATDYNSSDLAIAILNYLPSGLMGPALFQAGLNSILAQPPFSIVEKTSFVATNEIILGDGESDEGFNFGVGMGGFIAILIAVLVPAPFVSTSFAGEREKKTMEALLALPLSRRLILFGKLTAGMCLVAVFAVMNFVGIVLYDFILNFGPTPAVEAEDGTEAFSLAIKLEPLTVISISIAMMLSAFIAIGIGISIASLTKDVRTSESMYQAILMLPSMLVGLVGMFVGVPESMGGSALFLYLIPWSHALAIFHKMNSPSFYEVKSLLGYGLIADLLFHLIFLFISIAIIIAIAAKIFEREGIVN